MGGGLAVKITVEWQQLLSARSQIQSAEVQDRAGGSLRGESLSGLRFGIALGHQDWIGKTEGRKAKQSGDDEKDSAGSKWIDAN
jgi:hypothetical protein